MAKRESSTSQPLSAEVSYYQLLDVLTPEHQPSQGKLVKVAVLRNHFKDLADFALRTEIGQYWGLVEPGLILAKHCFRGLNRGVFAEGDMATSQRVLVYSWKPRFDYVWVGSRDPASGRLAKRQAPDGKVFVVLIRKNLEPGSKIFGTIVRWNWVRESDKLACAPVNYANRYAEKRWSQ